MAKIKKRVSKNSKWKNKKSYIQGNPKRLQAETLLHRKVWHDIFKELKGSPKQTKINKKNTTAKSIVPSKVIIQNQGRSNFTEKQEGVQHHQTSLTRSMKGTLWKMKGHK